MTHLCVGKLTIIGPDNGLSPVRRQAIIWTNAGISLIGPLGTKFSQILIAIHTFSFKKMHPKLSSAKWRPFFLGLNVLMHNHTKSNLPMLKSSHVNILVIWDMRHGLHWPPSPLLWLAGPNIVWDSLCRNGLWNRVARGNFHISQKSCRWGCAMRLWKSLTYDWTFYRVANRVFQQQPVALRIFVIK